MLDFDTALDIVLSSVGIGPTEFVPLHQGFGRTLSRSVISKVNLPPFTTSSVDGYAIKLPCPDDLIVTGEIPAGSSSRPPVGDPANAVQVFTGSMTPSDVDAIVMVEDVIRSGNQIKLTQTPAQGANLRFVGEEIKVGEFLLSQGTVLNPPALALLANSGVEGSEVFRRPRITVIETGNELRSPGENLAPGEIFAANGLALSSAASALGGDVALLRATDDPNSLRIAFQKAKEESDFVITSGGVSVGKHDHVRQVWSDLGAKEVFWKVAIRPGRPFFFARCDNGPLVFGLPGNPVSSLVTFYLLAMPAILKFQSRTPEPWTRARTSERMAGSPDVDVFVRVRMENGIVYPSSEQGSHMSSGLAKANSLARIPRGVVGAPVGSSLRVLPLRWS